MKPISPRVGPILAVRAAAIFTATIGAGMWLMSHNGGVYGEPSMIDHLWYVEIVLVGIAAFFSVRYFGWREVGFGRLRMRQLWWLAPVALIVAVMSANLANELRAGALTPQAVRFLAACAATTLMVGLSEELMYRGVVLQAFALRYGPAKAVVLSAVLFALLHSVNVLGGLSVGGMVVQLGFTFLFGLYFGTLAIRIGNITPLIIVHALWDFLLISSSYFQVDPLFAGVALPTQAVLTAVMWWRSWRSSPGSISH